MEPSWGNGRRNTDSGGPMVQPLPHILLVSRSSPLTDAASVWPRARSEGDRVMIIL